MCLMYGSIADLEWKVTYVGSADTEEYDQVLDSVLVGPVSVGQYRFVLQVRMQMQQAEAIVQLFKNWLTLVIPGCQNCIACWHLLLAYSILAQHRVRLVSIWRSREVVPLSCSVVIIDMPCSLYALAVCIYGQRLFMSFTINLSLRRARLLKHWDPWWYARFLVMPLCTDKCTWSKQAAAGWHHWDHNHLAQLPL